MLGILTQSDFTAVGQSDAGKIKGKVTDESDFVVGERVEFEIEIDTASDAACEAGSWTLDFGDARSTSGSTSATRSHAYLRAGVYIAVLNYTYFENVSSAAPDCQPRTSVDSVPVNIVEAEVQSETARFVGTDSNWFDPNNWSTGRVPEEGDNVTIDGAIRVVIDPELDPRSGTTGGSTGKVHLQDLQILNGATLETRPGVQMEFETISSDGTGNFYAYSSGWVGTAILNPGWGCPTWRCGFNPTYIHVDLFKFDGEGLAMSLGGAEPAAPGNTGAGYYANVQADNIELTNPMLQISTIYDFEPQAGDEFVIFEASESLTGTFSNFAEGDVVLSTESVDLVISYERNRIVLFAEQSI